MSADKPLNIRTPGRLLKVGLLGSTVLASTVLAGATAVHAQDQPGAAGDGQLEEIVVTAQKRAENLQTVPVSVQALSGKTLEQHNVSEFGDYVKLLPSVSYQTLAPSVTNVYMRGVVSGNDGSHSGPLPSVGVYLDDLPITTIRGVLDVHLYDMARVEVLTGPQSTLYGASSQAGTIKLITNQPDPTGFHAAYDVGFDSVDHGGIGHEAEGFVNIPLSDKVAIRLVGWEESDAGYIDNVPGSLTFPTSGITENNAARVKNDYNDVQTYGGRGALRIELDDDWIVTPSIIGQDQRANGVFGFDPKVGDLKLSHFLPEHDHDRFFQAGLTIQGKIYDLDVTYAGGYFDRWFGAEEDYTDYSFFYDSLTPLSLLIRNNSGLINPSQHISNDDKYTKVSHELRISSPSENRFRFTAGLFYEHQTHDVHIQYEIPGLGQAFSVSTLPGTFWLTEQVRTDRDAAAFGEATYDITDQLSVTGGVRVFDARNSLYGFYGYGALVSALVDSNPAVVPPSGEAAPQCRATGPFKDAPCVDLNKVVEQVGATYKASIAYKIDPDKLVYFTASDGYRPGGINRNGALPPYMADTLYNYEIGWKTTWNNKQVRWNGAFLLQYWDTFQFAFVGQSGLAQIANAGQATIKGLETEASWSIDPHFTLSGSGALTDARLSQSYCGTFNAQNQPITNGACANPQAPSGTVLPVTPLVKLNVTGRYDFDISDATSGFLQVAAVFNGRATSDLRLFARDDLGNLRPYTSIDLSGGIQTDEFSAQLYMKNAFDTRGQAFRYTECAVQVCGNDLAMTGRGNGRVYIVPIQPMTIGIKLGQKF